MQSCNRYQLHWSSKIQLCMYRTMYGKNRVVACCAHASRKMKKAVAVHIHCLAMSSGWALPMIWGCLLQMYFHTKCHNLPHCFCSYSCVFQLAAIFSPFTSHESVPFLFWYVLVILEHTVLTVFTQWHGETNCSYCLNEGVTHLNLLWLKFRHLGPSIVPVLPIGNTQSRQCSCVV